MTRLGRSHVLPALLIACLASPAAAGAQAPAAAPPELDALVTRVMSTFEVPGLALAIVKDGRVVVAKGYGVRTLGRPDPVNGRTLFGIASNTKVFTAVALGLLVERGAVAWDAPVVRYIPWFQMWDPWVTRELTVRDLLVHRSGLGLGAGDLLWWPPSTYERKEVVRRLRYLKPASSFRGTYAYDNVLYIVAGEVIEAVSGQTWEDFVTTRILRPVGMTGSNVLHSAAGTGANAATPHARVEGTVRPIAAFTSDTTNAAGGINSSAEDMARWMQVLLSGGQVPGGPRLHSERTARELTTIVTPLAPSAPPPELAPLRSNFSGYALGLGLRDYRGRRMVTHTGGLPGYVSRVTTLPDDQLGIAVLTNQEAGEAFEAITYHVIDHYLRAPAVDWVAAFQQSRARGTAATAAAIDKASASRDATSQPSLPLSGYAGSYEDAWYGRVEVSADAGRLVMRFSATPSLVGDLEHWQHDTFVVRWRNRELRADAFVTFALTPEGTVEQAKMRAVSPDTDFSFDFHDLLLKPVPPPAAGER